jgi:hypothetical protein
MRGALIAGAGLAIFQQFAGPNTETAATALGPWRMVEPG